ncbi:hypothetical protein FXO37_23579 [Capsicum annuum]|nr:hypothetical protein FXO37_23579 [Capsicum annuum]
MAIPVAGFASTLPSDSTLRLFTTVERNCFTHSSQLEYLEDSIGNRAIFLGKKRGFALSTTEFPELRSGCIYFADDRYAWKYNFGGDDMGIYDYEDNSIIEEVLPPSSNWFIPDA